MTLGGIAAHFATKSDECDLTIYADYIRSVVQSNHPAAVWSLQPPTEAGANLSTLKEWTA